MRHTIKYLICMVLSSTLWSQSIEFRQEGSHIMVYAHFPDGVIQSYPLEKFQVCLDPDPDGDCPDGEDIQVVISSEGYKYGGMVEFSNYKNDILFSIQSGFPIAGWVYIWNEHDDHPQLVGTVDGKAYIGRYKSPSSTKIAILTKGDSDYFNGILQILDFPNKKFAQIDDNLIIDLGLDKTNYVGVDSFNWLNEADFSINYRIFDDQEMMDPKDDPVPRGIAYFHYSFENGLPKFTKIDKPPSIKMKRTNSKASKKIVGPRRK